jgi:hypothetical protein
MKEVKSPSTFFKWQGKLAEVTGIAIGKVILFTTKEHCPHCGKPVEELHSEIEDSPYFQSGAEPIDTISVKQTQA